MTGHRSILADDTPSIIQFENANESRAYPFSDNTTFMTRDGKTFRNELITDLHLVLPHGRVPYLSSVYVSKGMVSACIRVMNVERELSLTKTNFDVSILRNLADADTAEMTEDSFRELLTKLKSSGFRSKASDALSVVIKASEFSPYMPYRLEQTSGTEDSGGIITFGEIEFPETPETYRFDDVSVPVTEGAVARYQPALVRRFTDPRTGEHVSGDTKIEFSAHVNATRSGNHVKLGLSEASQSDLMSDCDRDKPKNACGAVPVNKINGVYPDSKKRIVIWFH